MKNKNLFDIRQFELWDGFIIPHLFFSVIRTGINVLNEEGCNVLLFKKEAGQLIQIAKQEDVDYCSNFEVTKKEEKEYSERGLLKQWQHILLYFFKEIKCANCGFSFPIVWYCATRLGLICYPCWKYLMCPKVEWQFIDKPEDYIKKEFKIKNKSK